jgi:hypothetical protein
MTKVFGIETIKKAISAGFKLGTDAVNDLKDGKLSWDEYPGLVIDLVGTGAVISSGKDLIAELNELDEDEIAELEQYVKDQFNVAGPEAKRKIDASVHAAAALYDLYFAFSGK